MKKLLVFSSLFVSVIASSQNVGIGTTTPQTTLDVKGNQRVGGLTKYMSYDSVSGKIIWSNSNLFVPTSQYIMQHSASAEGLYYSGGQLEYRNQAGTPVFFTNWTNGNGYFSGNLGINNSAPQFPISLNGSLGDKISLWTDGTPTHYGFGIQGSLLQMFAKTSLDDIGFGYGSSASFTEAMRIKGNGNVGIGTSIPSSKLEITHNGASAFGTAILINQDVIGNSDGPKIQFRKTMISPKSWTAGVLNGVDVGSFAISEDGGTAGFGNPRFIIAQGGNVGIGTPSPSEKLQVAGNVKAADYVYTIPKTFYYALSGTDFDAAISSDIASKSPVSGDISLSTSGSFRKVMAPVHLPHGAVLQSMTVYLINNSATENLLVLLSRKNQLNNSAGDNLGFIISNTSSGVGTATPYSTSLSSNVVDNSLYTYYLYAGLDNSANPWPGNMYLRAVIIQYTLPSAQ